MISTPEFSLVLRNSDKNLKGYHGTFQWPALGPVECKDWDPKPCCGKGLHGMLWGEGSSAYYSKDPTAVWQVVKVQTDLIVKIPENKEEYPKVKFPKGEVLFSGDREKAVQFLQDNAGRPVACAYGNVRTGDRGTSTSGEYGHSTSGDEGHSTSGYYGHSTSGVEGHSTSGYRGTSTSGNRGTSTSGEYGQCRAGLWGLIAVKFYDPAKGVYRTATAEIDGVNFLPNVWYHVVNGKITVG